MTEKEVIINIDITDWDEEYETADRKVYDQDDLVEHAKEGVKPMELARNIIAAREREEADPNIIKSNKLTLNIGGMFQINQIYARRMKEYNTKNGQSIKHRELVCENGDSDPNVVDGKSDKGCQRAINYLMNTAIGHVKSRLNIIAVNLGADGIKKNVAALIGEIKEIEAELLAKLE
jgi:hypothetical protein